MHFERINPSPQLEPYIDCYWFVDSDDPAPHRQKIIPDGYTEIIFHFGDPYRILISDTWELQSKELLAGQISKYFFLENTGTSKVVGIKFKPAGLTDLFGLDMKAFVDKVVPVESAPIPGIGLLKDEIAGDANHKEIVSTIEQRLRLYSKAAGAKDVRIDRAVQLIFDSNGSVAVGELCAQLFINERQLQRLFQKYVGLSPKFFSRVIRFNYIFKLLQEGHSSWTEITYHSGYFDQSHFIRDFKAFTGEDPSAYFFEETNMANFFLKKK